MKKLIYFFISVILIISIIIRYNQINYEDDIVLVFLGFLLFVMIMLITIKEADGRKQHRVIDKDDKVISVHNSEEEAIEAANNADKETKIVCFIVKNGKYEKDLLNAKKKN